MTSFPPKLFLCVLACVLMISGSLELVAQDKGDDAKLDGAAFDKQSLALRTALHYDSSLTAPLKSLIRLYEKAGRMEDLLGLYRAHTTQYADDVGAKVVMIRLLKVLERVEVGEMVQAAAQQHPENADLKHLLYQDYKRRGDQRALETLSEAIDLQKRPEIKQSWMNVLLAQAEENDARDLAERHLQEMLSTEGHTAATLLSLATQMHRYHFEEMALSTLSKAKAKKPDAELGVEIELLAARAEAGLGKYEQVARRMDALLKRLAPDYLRRREIMKLRISLVKNNADRDKLIKQAKERYEKEQMNEGAALDYAELLSANEMRRKAAGVLVDASKRLPASEQLEKEALRLLDRIGDEKGLLSFLEERLKNDPRREDLKYRLVKAEYLAGKNKAARQGFSTIIDKLEKPERARRLLDLARYLRQMSLPAESADLLTEVVELLPERLDVKRELLETLLALEQRAKAEKILENLSVTDAEIENFVDLVQFMVQADFLVAARNALESRLKSEGERFDLNLLLVSVLGKTGDQEKAEKILIKSREAADTTVRYAQWLESGLSLYELLDSPEQFFDSEQFRFLEEGGEWTAERVDRFLTLCELGDRKKLGDRVAQALRNQLADISLPEPLKLRLRMLLVKALDKSPDNAGEVEEQLKLLAKEDERHADEYQLRRALLYHSNSRPDLARDLLASVDMEKVVDDSILRAAYLVFLEYSLVDSAKICLKKLTASQATDTGGWEKRLSLLAVLGEEEELRVVLRRLLVGVDRMILKSDTLRSLRLHLLDSYWRSISRLLKKDDKESLSAVLVMLDSVDRDAGQTRDRGWSIWARAYALNQLERVAARDEVIKDLRLFLNERSETVEKGDDDNTMIAFPDGLAVSIGAAVDLLKSKQEGGRQDLLKGRNSEGPLGAIEMAWAFEADPGARILQIEPVGEKMVMVLDDQGSVYNIDAENGKLRWHEQYRTAIKNGGVISRQSSLGGGSRRTVLGNQGGRIVVTGNSISVSAYSRPYGGARVGSTVGRSSGYFALGVKKVSSMRVDDDGGFFLSVGDQIKAYRSEDGSMLWQSALTSTRGAEVKPTNASPTVARPDPVLFLDGDHLLCYAPALNVAVCFQRQTGKLIWSRDLSSSAASKGRVYSLNSGAAFSEGRLFVFGKSCEILDSTSGETLWTFDDRGVHRFPVRLDQVSESDESQDETKVSSTSVSNVSPASPINTSPFARPGTSALAQPATTFVNHEGDLAGRMSQMKPFLQGEGALVAPAVQWNGARLAQMADADARIEGGRLLLMGSDRVREISLALPVGAQWVSAHGVVLGTIGDAMWFLDGPVLKRLNLRNKQTLSVRIEGEIEGSDMRAVMSGSRIYVSNARGLTILNAHSGNRIGNYEWPTLMTDYMAKRIGGRGEGPVGKIATWQGYVRSVPGRPVYCFPLRNRVKGDRIFTMVGEAGFAMLRKRRVEDPPK